MKRRQTAVSLLVCVASALTAPSRSEEVTLGQSVEGRPLTARVHGPEDAPETLLIVASIHGTEPAGTPLVERLEAWMKGHPKEWGGKRIVIVPVANPDGYAKRERFNVHGVDLNRNFPADNRTEHTTHGDAPLSEPESRALMRALRTYNPSRVVSLHQPIDCIDYDGPGEALAQAMSDAIDGRLPVKKLGGRPGSMGSYVGETLGKPIITVEFPRYAEKRSTDELWDDYGAALVAFIRGVPDNQQD
ncbi:DUF2817 domain-containing protein [Botrimarina mediterranea]|uniref:Murein peptide amidase A n=1 Tax=Botrimarina mediterranea TaxID=2528022 RepID=A0A518K516_9BACT|nr:DUF2817 domain-containing protein [Botrimarina mediterranea]QDV72893.1 murein peptide amidase A [Botrimarina mediterranea]